MTKTFRDLQDSLGHAAPFFLYGGICLFGRAMQYLQFDAAFKGFNVFVVVETSQKNHIVVKENSNNVS